MSLDWRDVLSPKRAFAFAAKLFMLLFILLAAFSFLGSLAASTQLSLADLAVLGLVLSVLSFGAFVVVLIRESENSRQSRVQTRGAERTPLLPQQAQREEDE